MNGKKRKRVIAAFFFALLLVQDFYPAAAYALTSGPAQPEMQKFSPAGVSDMVDLFSGDFKYDIPLMDVGGYPLNLSYHSGSNMEEEASWVGMGWTLNPGSMNRSMRGLPDDFTGDDHSATGDPQDAIQTIQHQKNFVKIGGDFVLKGTLFGFNVGSPSLKVGVYKDNYWGIGAELGAGLSFDLFRNSTTALTAGLQMTTDTRTGVTLQPSFSLSAAYDADNENNKVGLTGGFKYNTRAGLESQSLALSTGVPVDVAGDQVGQHTAGFELGTFTHNFGHAYVPTFGYNSAVSDAFFSFDVGGTGTGVYGGGGGEGYVHQETNMEPHSTVPAYGYLNYTAGTNNPAALLDFNREKDLTFMPGMPAIPVPVSTEDYFEASSQAGAQQFRPYYNGTYLVYDRPFTKNSKSLTAGVSAGFGDVFQLGAELTYGTNQGVTHKWPNTSFQQYTTAPGSGYSGYENVYFKQAGEHTLTDNSYYDELGKDVTQKIGVAPGSVVNATAIFLGANSQPTAPANAPIYRGTRDVRTTTFSYLTAAQAKYYALDKKVNGVCRVDQMNTTNPVMTVRKPHHISEITVTDKDGKRMVYGIPVYNTDREEVSMSIAGYTPSSTNTSPFYTARLTGLATYTPVTSSTPNGDNGEGNNKGRMNVYNRKITPPYATSWLLTGILSPDYVDLTGDGITDDDLGTAVKFSYSNSTAGGTNYMWRTPFYANNANYNEGHLMDQKDDKANYVFGSKELWYMDSIRSKTMIAIFYKSPRVDGFGVSSENGGIDTVPMLRLDSIQLFSIADRAKNGVNAIPIKVAHFAYDYSLVPGVPNNSGTVVTDLNVGSGNLNATSGKLTLRKVWFTFGNSSRGQTNPYVFSYDMRLISSIPGLDQSGNPSHQEPTDQYAPRETDRWGTYRQNYFTTASHAFLNSEFPYSTQVHAFESYDERLLADRFASKWQLVSIITPTDGVITVNYEADDYAYVQNQKAMMMCQMVGVGTDYVGGQQTTAVTNLGTTGLGALNTDVVYVRVPVPIKSGLPQDFTNMYLLGSDGQNMSNIFYKVRTNLDQNKSNPDAVADCDYVYGYAQVDYSKMSEFKPDPSDNTIWSIPVVLMNSYNPIAIAAWQMMQNELPQYAYPNYDNSDVTTLTGDVSAAVRSIISAFGTLEELYEPFTTIASNAGYASDIISSSSLIRLNCPNSVVPTTGPGDGTTYTTSYGKVGGGSRVQSIELNDNWATMSSVGKETHYGIRYSYQTNDDQGNTISSGVAIYEPEIGNEENPWHQPVDYTQTIQWGMDRYHYMEKPFGESYFPSPYVGYSQVKATPYGVQGVDGSNPGSTTVNQSQSYTGYTLNTFYTAKDFPTQTDYLPLEEDDYEYDLTVLLFAAEYTEKVTTSQGFKVILNDMHGKQKSTETYDNNGNLISSTQYYYSVTDPNAQTKTLNNAVLAMDANGNITASGTLVGTDIDVVTDLRESNSSGSGNSVGANTGAFVAFGVWPYAGFNYSGDASLRSYNSAATVKVIHQYGLLQEVRTTLYGSTLTADNLVWDGQTGEVLLTRNQNEFNDYTYTLNYPAFRGYCGMSGAFQNIAMVLSGFQTDADGAVTSSTSLLSPGDELVDIDAGQNIHGWLIQPPDNSLRFIDNTGNFIQVSSGTFMVVRSGRRNLLTVPAGSVVTMANPLIQTSNGYVLQADVDQQVLDSKAVTFKDEWGAPVPNFMYTPPPQSSQWPINNQRGKNSGFINYNLTDGSSTPDCDPTTLLAGVTVQNIDGISVATPTRGYLDFGGILGPPPADNATITSVQLVLNPVAGGMSTANGNGTNAAYVSRVTQEVDCNGNFGETVTWATKPSTTTVDQVAIAANTSSSAPYIVDITNMFLDWYNTPSASRDDGDFAICLSMQDELQHQNVQMEFNGDNSPNPSYIQINYSIPGGCISPVTQIFNPYYTGVKGNWRPYYKYDYHVSRTGAPGNPGQVGGTNIRNSGYYSSYTPFWFFNTGTLMPIAPVAGSPGNVSDPRWVWATQTIYYDQKGNEVENVDALNRYSADLFGYQQSLPVAVAMNARHNEIAFDGFEDYYFTLPVAPAQCPTSRQLDFGLTYNGSEYCSGASCVLNTASHSGNYSLNLKGSVSASSGAGLASPPTQWVGYDAAGHSILLANEQQAGFAPISGNWYLLSFWVQDTDVTTNIVQGLTVTINGAQMPLSALQCPVVEGWKQVNVKFQAAGAFSLQLTGSDIYIDDLRLLPMAGEMKTFVYDDQSLRLMGQLDENNFGILYEYDEEGTPIRTKKETERGMMTVKENRESMKPH